MAKLAFGPFEVDPTAGELRKGSATIRLAPQPFEILLLLLERPGEIVTREHLRERIWTDGTFVDFERGLNSAMAKLRRALSDSADAPRYIETVPGRGYRFIAGIQVAGTVDLPLLPLTEQSTRKRGSSRAIWLIGAVIAGCSLVVGWFMRSPRTPANRKLVVLTRDEGLSDSAALSSDGKFVIYSNRNAAGERDLYIRQVTGGQPVRLTFDGRENTTPSFSPDGSKVAFRSNRNGGGIYEMPAFGGAPRLIAPEGWNPRYSPDGTQIAYWTGAQSIAASVPQSSNIWVASSSGGMRRRVGQGFTSARYPIWSSDGKHLLAVGYSSDRIFDNQQIDWWFIDLGNKPPVRTGVYQKLSDAGILSATKFTPVPSLPKPGCWLADGTVYFSGRVGDASNIFRTRVSQSRGMVTEEVEPVTVASVNEVDPTCSMDGAVVFTSFQSHENVWTVNSDVHHGAPASELKQMLFGPAIQHNPSLSSDGQHLAYISDSSGHPSVWLRDLVSGENQIVAPSPFVESFAVSNATGTRIAFSVYETKGRAVYVSSPGGTPKRVCEGCLRATDWSRDEKSLLVFGGNRYKISTLNLATHEQRVLVEHPTYNVLYGRLSPDNRWISFTARMQPSQGVIMVAPIAGQNQIGEKDWIRIATTATDDYANWLEDGNTLLFTSNTDGYSCLWGQRLDAVSRKPLGAAYAVQHFHGLTFTHKSWSVAGDRVALTLQEVTGNIWMLSPDRK